MTRPTEQECIRSAGAVLAASDLAIAQMTPREQAEAAWEPGSIHTVDELEDLIRDGRGIQPVHHDAVAFDELHARDARSRARRGLPPRRRGGDCDEVRPNDGT